ncbi:MAG: DNA polymerase III subunit delta [Bacteroidetes bacterium]|nr:DNA polymerase III subunit delta [Bacteroidota bacterium]
MLFKEIIGQFDVKKRLIQSVKERRISHAQLFLGPEGSGKLALAIAYAQYISCTDRQEEDSCGICPSCIKYQKLIHPDLHFFYPIAPTQKFPKPISSNFLPEWRTALINSNYYLNLNEWYDEIGLENKQGIINANDCNEIIKKVSLKPYESEFKIVIIWIVEKLFHAAAPKLLKNFEEPPEKTLFILISENRHQILNTILSRTQLVNIPKISDEPLENYLSSKFSNIPNIKSITAIANGNYKAAQRLIEEFEDEKTNFETFRNWMLNCYNSKTIDINKFVDETSKIGREKQKALLSYSIRIFRDCVLMHYGNSSLVKQEQEMKNFLSKFYIFVNPSNILSINEEFNKSIFHIERNVNSKLVFMDLSLKMCNLLKIK